MQTIQQKRAHYALQKVIELKQKLGDKEQKEFKSYAAALPAMIHMNGLGQAAAFYYAKNGTHRKLYDLLSEWLCQDSQPYCKDKDADNNKKTGLLEGITESNMQTYRLAQVEAQALLDWVKIFAKAYMADDSKNDEKEKEKNGATAL